MGLGKMILFSKRDIA